MPLKPIYTDPKNPSPDALVESWLASPPPWRDHTTVPATARVPPDDEAAKAAKRRGAAYVPTSDEERECVNLALWLRRPLLVTGAPGIGKSSLAYGIAVALGLGAPLRWEINSRSTLQDGLYTYDAVSHFRAASAVGAGSVPASDYIRLGPLGTAFVPTERPRVLLVDEIDKASWDLPNDLLHVFEEGEFIIPELTRQDEVGRVQLHDSADPRDTVDVLKGRVRVRHHPIVVITSNQERELSGAFLRRCVSLRMEALSPEKLAEVVRVQFEKSREQPLLDLVNGGDMATDVALQALFTTLHGADFAAIRARLEKGR